MGRTVVPYTGTSNVLFTVPDQVTSITAELVAGRALSGEMPGRVVATFPVTPGQAIYCNVGGNGQIATPTADGAGGFNGGGKAYKQPSGTQPCGGAGMTDIRIGGTALANRVLVAGAPGGRGGTGFGGKGAGGNFAGGIGGKGGGSTGGAGATGKIDATTGGDHGDGGTQAAGGAAGAGNVATGTDGSAGALGLGGNGSNGPVTSPHGGQGGGGGAGYYGGGGGEQGGFSDSLGADAWAYGGGGGAGGSNFVAATINGVAPTGVTNTQGYNLVLDVGGIGQVIGYIVFTYDTKPVVQAKNPDLTHGVSTSGSSIHNFVFNYSDDSLARAASYQVIVERNSTGGVWIDTGQVALTNDGLTPGAYDITVPIDFAGLPTNEYFRWKVRAWDLTGHVSDYTAYTLFKYKAPPTFSISPANASVLGNGKPTVDWSDEVFTMTAFQGSFQVQFIRTSDSAVLHDSGVVESQDTSYTPPTDILPNAGAYTIKVTVTDSDGLATTNTVSVTTSYVVPASFNYTVDTSKVDTLGYVDIDWSSAVSDVAWNSWKVYRKTLDDTSWTLLREITDIGTHNYQDFLVVSGETYQYTVTQTALVSGTLVESTPGYLSGGVLDMNTYTIQSTQYWIIDIIDPTLSTFIPNVTSAPMSEAYEEEEYVIIGRGRKVDYGTRLGYSGTLTAQLRGQTLPTVIRKKIELMRKAQDTYYLRTPFGDLFMIGLGDAEFAPLPGIGPYAMYDASIPFFEVAGDIVDEQATVIINVTYTLENAEVVDNGDETSTITMS